MSGKGSSSRRHGNGKTQEEDRGERDSSDTGSGSGPGRRGSGGQAAVRAAKDRLIVPPRRGEVMKRILADLVPSGSPN